MRKAQLKIICFTLGGLLTASPNASRLYAEEQHKLYTDLLKQHVKEGRVDYRNLKQDPRLDQYIRQLSDTNPEDLSSKRSKLAFWINAYNAYTLKIICDRYPIKSINELHTGGLAFGTVLRTTVWHKKLVTINKKRTSLNTIEHKIIRSRFDEPRIHFALVCAAKSCPPLRAEAYEADKLDTQLNQQAKLFLSEKNKNAFDVENKIAKISPIFAWFKNDFKKESPSVLDYIAKFLPEEAATSIKNNRKNWEIKYTRYDWSLNE